MLWGLGIPLGLWYLLDKHRRKPLGLNSPEFIARYSSLTLPFLSDRWYFECVNMLRRFLVILVLDLLAPVDNVFVQANLVILVLSAFLVFSLILQPFQNIWNNRLVILWLICALWFALASVAFEGLNQSADASSAESASRGGFLAGFLVLAVSFSIVATAVVTYQEVKIYLKARRAKVRAEPAEFARLDSEIRNQVSTQMPETSRLLVSVFESFNVMQKHAALRDLRSRPHAKLPSVTDIDEVELVEMTDKI